MIKYFVSLILGVFMSLSNYNIDFAVSADISSEVALEMIKNTVEKQTGKVVESIVPKIITITEGYGVAEVDKTIFTGFTVFFKKEPVSC